jgi:hypothetical protein
MLGAVAAISPARAAQRRAARKSPCEGSRIKRSGVVRRLTRGLYRQITAGGKRRRGQLIQCPMTSVVVVMRNSHEVRCVKCFKALWSWNLTTLPFALALVTPRTELVLSSEGAHSPMRASLGQSIDAGCLPQRSTSVALRTLLCGFLRWLALRPHRPRTPPLLSPEQGSRSGASNCTTQRLGYPFHRSRPLIFRPNRSLTCSSKLAFQVLEMSRKFRPLEC